MTWLQKGKQRVCAPLACANCGLHPLSTAENLKPYSRGPPLALWFRGSLVRPVISCLVNGDFSHKAFI